MAGRSLVWPGLAAALGFVLLCGLGIWQLQRLAWKEALLADMAERMAAPAEPLPEETAWPALDPGGYDYRHVKVTGRFIHAQEAHVFRPRDGEPGYLILTPLQLSSGAYVIVNRGFVPQAEKDPSTRRAGLTPGTLILTGLMRPPEARNLFTPADDPLANIWFTRDPAAIAAHAALAPVAPFTIDADFEHDSAVLPRGGATVVAIRNDHFAYAITWFGLAVALAGVFGTFAWRKLRKTG
jgi:surfeit locus 1 family protein